VNSRLPAAVRRLAPRVRLAAALECLPEPQRLVLALRLVDGLSPLETAGALRVSAREVESRFAAALESIAGELGASARRAA
jgi:DNA-directed RNA polymerase specialized sigma24 family protein